MVTNRFLVFFLSVFLLSLTACKYRTGVGYNQGYAPEQPIPFEHSLHAGEYKIPCQYCHAQVERSRHSTVPSLNICMNCHIVVKTDSPHIQKLHEAVDEGKSIPWVKVHMLPDFVHFNHRRHVLKLQSRMGEGEVACTTCHGQVDQMKVLSQQSDLSMGWCVSCHREPENNASLNCTTCHQ